MDIDIVNSHLERIEEQVNIIIRPRTIRRSLFSPDPNEELIRRFQDLSDHITSTSSVTRARAIFNRLRNYNFLSLLAVIQYNTALNHLLGEDGIQQLRSDLKRYNNQMVNYIILPLGGQTAFVPESFRMLIDRIYFNRTEEERISYTENVVRRIKTLRQMYVSLLFIIQEYREVRQEFFERFSNFISLETITFLDGQIILFAGERNTMSIMALSQLMPLP